MTDVYIYGSLSPRVSTYSLCHLTGYAFCAETKIGVDVVCQCT